MNQYQCDICVHGDDLSTAADGTDTYGLVKKADRFLEVPRTEGISTTELVGRMLLMTRSHHMANADSTAFEESKQARKMFPTTNRIVQFALQADGSPRRDPLPNERIIYVDGAFDLFHVGHIELFRQAKQLGDYLLVGVHEDQTINTIKGHNYPVMNLYERVLGVLSCKYVDEVIIGAPYSIDKKLLATYNVHKVVHGNTPTIPDRGGVDPYALAKEKGIYVQLETHFWP